MSSQADFRVLQSTWGLVPLKPCQKVGQWGTNQTCQHRDLHAPPVLPLRCYQGEPGSCTAPSTGDVQPPCSSGFQGLKMTQFLDWMQVSNSLSASPSSLRWIDFVPEPMGFFNSKSLRNRERMCYWTVLCLRRALNITAGPLGDDITHSSHFCGVEILHRLTVKPWILLRFTMALRLEHIYKKIQIWDQTENHMCTLQHPINLQGYWVGTGKCLSSHRDNSSPPMGHIPSNSKLCPQGQMGGVFQTCPRAGWNGAGDGITSQPENQGTL